jgi:hypothetical protein
MVTILKQNWKIFLVASVTLGLAPFNPPHIIGKLEWLLGGNAFDKEAGMQLMDWYDLLLHGSPWVLLIISGSLIFFSKPPQ